MSPTPGQESMPEVRMTGTREHRAFMTYNGHAFTVPKECGPQIVRAVNAFPRMYDALAAIEAARDECAETGQWPIRGALPDGVPAIGADQAFDDWAADVCAWALEGLK